MTSPYDDPFGIDPFDAEPGLTNVDMTDMFDTPGVPAETDDVRFGAGGYTGGYDGIDGCWFSNDGYVYAPDGTRIGAC